jgi:fido (protein-threonine AMPylation protein)
MTRSTSKSSLSIDVAKSIIRDALAGKYQGFDAAKLDLALRKSWVAAHEANSQDALNALLRPIDGPETDVWNHVVILHLIERFWRHKRAMRNSTTTIHGALYGFADGDGHIRQASFIEDFGGEVPTAVADVGSALNELEMMVAELTPLFAEQPIHSQATFLALAFASIIRIHPFADGNGRTARLVVQCCLRSWNKAYLPLPKVRNDEGWRQALSEAVAGRPDRLTEEFAHRMKS